MLSTGAFRQFLVAFISSLSLFSAGVSYSWITPLMVGLKRPNPDVFLTPDQASWVVAFIEVGNLFTPLPAGFLVDHWGRKFCLLITAPLYIATWFLILYVKTVPSLYFMRIVQGMAMSVQYTVLPMYLAEIAGVSRRGALSSFFQGMWFLGILYEYFLGAFFGYDGLTWFSIGPPVVFLIAFLWCPESPYFLLMRGRREEAEKVLAWLRGVNLEGVAHELKGIEDSILEEKEDKGSWKDVIGTPVGRKAMLIVVLLSMTEIMSGLTAILSYATDTFERSSGDMDLANMATIILGVAICLVTVLSAFLSDRLGRRPLLLISSTASTVCLIFATVYFYIEEKTNIDTSNYIWIVYSAIILYCIMLSFGVGALIPTLQGELFPNSTRGIASGINTLNITILSFICLKLYQVIADSIGMFVNYAIFSVFCFIGSVAIYFCLPETRGKTFAEINKILQSECE